MNVFRRASRITKHALVFELNIYKSLLRWLSRRPSIPAGFEPVGYAKLATPVVAQTTGDVCLTFLSTTPPNNLMLGYLISGFRQTY